MRTVFIAIVASMSVMACSDTQQDTTPSDAEEIASTVDQNAAESDCYIERYAPDYSPDLVISGCTLALDAELTDAERSEALVNRGNAYRDLEELAQSRADLEAAIALTSDDASALRMLGWTYRELGEIELAETALTKAISLSPDNWQGYLSRCVVRGHDASEHEQAAKDCLMAIELDHTSDDSVFFASYNLNQIGEFEQSVSIIETYSEEAELSPRVYEQYIVALEGKREFEKAIRIAEAASYNYPDIADFQLKADELQAR